MTRDVRERMVQLKLQTASDELLAEITGPLDAIAGDAAEEVQAAIVDGEIDLKLTIRDWEHPS